MTKNLIAISGLILTGVIVWHIVTIVQTVTTTLQIIGR